MVAAAAARFAALPAANQRRFGPGSATGAHRAQASGRRGNGAKAVATAAASSATATVGQWRSSSNGAAMARRRPKVSVRAAVANPTGEAAGQSESVHPEQPQSIDEINKADILGYGADLDESHPGFGDEEFTSRRSMIARLAHDYKDGTPIPRVEYTEAERRTWQEVLRTMKVLYPLGACREYNEGFDKCGFTEDEVPQLEDVSQMLFKATGWRLRPAAGLLHPRAFLNGLAFGYFHSTQYMRHHSDPLYTPEPDLCHELLGHMPMFMNEGFAKTVRAIGEASLGAPESDIWHLIKVYWYTVEFGAVREGSQYVAWVELLNAKYKAFGAGILSSIAELKNLMLGYHEVDEREVDFQELNPFCRQPAMSYNDGCQRRYFVLDLQRNGVREFSDFMTVLHERGESYADILKTVANKEEERQSAKALN